MTQRGVRKSLRRKLGGLYIPAQEGALDTAIRRTNNTCPELPNAESTGVRHTFHTPSGIRTKKDWAFSMLELLVTVFIIAVIAAVSIPTAVSSLQKYHLHSDASAMASYLNLGRMRAASQYSPYSLDLDPSVSPAVFAIEKLTGATYNPLNPSFTGAYNSFSPKVYDPGVQYSSTDSTFAICRPSGITVYPGTITADPASCTGPFQFCFNTRGAPVQCTGSPGSPLTSGGLAIYLQNKDKLTDAVTISVGGVVQVWNWEPTSTKWYLR